MARIRTIKPGFFSSLTVAKLDYATRLTFVGLWTYVDDDGRGVDEPRLVKAAVWPLDDDVTTGKVERHLDALAAVGLIQRYLHNGKRYLAVTNFAEHQSISKKRESILPGPDDDGSTLSGSVPGGLPEDDGRAPRGKGKEGNGEGRDSRGGGAAELRATGKEPTGSRKYPKFPDVHRAYLHRVWTRRIGGVDFGRFVRAFATIYPNRPAEEPDPPPTVDALAQAIRDDHAAWVRPWTVYLAVLAFAREKRSADATRAAHWTVEQFVGDYQRWLELAQEPTVAVVA